MMVGRDVEFAVTKGEAHPGEVVLDVKNLTDPSKVHKNNAVKDVSFQVHAGEIVCVASACLLDMLEGEFTDFSVIS